jgi:hypothetical protein
MKTWNNKTMHARISSEWKSKFEKRAYKRSGECWYNDWNIPGINLLPQHTLCPPDAYIGNRMVCVPIGW